MALKALNSVAGFSVGEVANVVIYANTDITTANLIVSAKSNLNSISNITITGGSPGYLLSTDGSGGLSFIAPPSTNTLTNGTSNVSIPTVNGNITLSVNGTSNVGVFSQTSLDMQGNVNPAQANTYQLGNATNRWNNVFSNTANVAGNIAAGGLLTDNLYYANGSPWDFILPAGSNTQIQYNDGAGGFGANANFTFDQATNNLALNGNIIIGSSGKNQIVNAGANVLEIRGGLNDANGIVALAAGDYGNSVNWGKIAIYGNIGGNATAQLEANIVNFQPGGGGANVIKFDVLSYNSTTTTSGAIQVAGGIGATGNVYVGGLLSVNGNANVNNLGTAQVLATANVTAPQLISNIATGTAPFVVTSTTEVANLNVANAGYATNAGSAATATNASAVLSNVETSGTVYPTFISSTANANYSLQSNTAFSANLANGGLIATTFAGNLNGTTVDVSGQITSTQATGTAPFVINSTTRVANLNVDTAGAADTATNASSVLANVESSGVVYPTFISSTANANYSLQSNTAFSANLANGAITATTFVGNLNGTTVDVSGQITSTLTTGTAPLSVASTTRVANLNVNYANVSDFEVVTAQTTGTYYPVFVNGSSTANYALGANSNLAFNAATGNLSATILNASGNITAGTGITVTTGGMTITGNIDVTGNFNVTGNLNYSNVTDLVVGDPLIYMGANNTGNLYDLGIVASYNDGTYQHTGLARNHNNGYWTFFDDVAQEPTTVIDWANATYPTVYGGNFLATGNVISNQVFANANITTPQFISNVATGTAPLQVTSTTRVANLSVDYANVSDYGVVTSQSTGTYYPTFVNSSSTGNLALASNSAISANLANGALIATTFAGNLSGTNANVTTANVLNNIILGNSTVTTTISWDSATTSSVSANQTIASISTTGITGLEFLVKGVDSAGSGKYSVATVQAVTDGTNVDYSVFGTVNLGGSTGALAVNISGGFVRLQVTPASSNSTVWTTQVRYI